MKKADTICIIPAKAASSRLPGKNMKPFHGHPLLYYTLYAARMCPSIDAVYVSTDSPEIQRFSESMGAEVPFLRDGSLSLPETHSTLPVLDMLERLGIPDETLVVKLLPTYAMRRKDSLARAVHAARTEARNVVSVARVGRTINHLKHRDARGLIVPLPGVAPKYNFQDQDAPGVYAMSGAIQCASAEALRREKTFQYGTPHGYILDFFEGFDINTPYEWGIAEALFPIFIAQENTARP